MITELSVSIPTPDGTADGYLYYREDAAARPGVIELTDIHGLRDTVREMARRVAQDGYAVLLPNIFYRTGRPPMFDFPVNFAEDRTKKRFAELTDPLTPEAMARDAAAYVDFMRAQQSVARGPMGVVGYCFGGAMALRTAAARPDDIGAAASFHGGRLHSDARTSPDRELPRVKAALHFGHAFEDQSMPPEAIAKLDEALAAWGGSYESMVYDHAKHGWTVPDSKAYNHEEAERAYANMMTLFSRALATGASSHHERILSWE